MKFLFTAWLGLALLLGVNSFHSESNRKLFAAQNISENIDSEHFVGDSCRLDTLRALRGEVISPKDDGVRPAVFHEHSSLVERLPDGLIRKTLRPTKHNSYQYMLDKLNHEVAMLSNLRSSHAYFRVEGHVEGYFTINKPTLGD